MSELVALAAWASLMALAGIGGLAVLREVRGLMKDVVETFKWYRGEHWKSVHENDP